MKKQIKLFIIFIFSFLIIPNTVRADYICDGKETTSDGYCNIQDKVKNFEFFQNEIPNEIKHRFSLNGENKTLTEATYYALITNSDGTAKKESLFCIDPNLNAPASLISGRGLNISSAYDRAITKIYQIYLYETSVNKDDELANRLAAGSAMRLLTARVGYSQNSSGVTDETPLIKGVVDLGAQIEDVSNPYGIATWEQNGNLDLLKGYYCAAVVTIGSEMKYINTTSINNCTNYLKSQNKPEIYTSEVKDYDISIKKSRQLSTTYSDTSNELITKIEFELDGQDEIKNAVEFGITPSIKVKDVVCTVGNTTLDCSIASDSSIKNGTDLINTASNKLTVDVKALTTDFIKTSKVKIKLVFDFYFPPSTNHLAIMQQKRGKQRMVGYFDDSTLEVTEEKTFTFPKTCRKVGDEYYLGKEKVTISDYLNAGCCDGIEEKDLNITTDKEYYSMYCDSSDTVVLKEKCINNSCTGETLNDNELYTDSYVDQVDMQVIMSRITSADKNYLNNANENSRNSLAKQISSMVYWRDNTFLSNSGVEKDNIYCGLYTSENTHFYYPAATVNATSGSYFVFAKNSSGEYTQPYITGSMESTFHISYYVWKRDYIDAVQKEKTAYEEWQKASNEYEAYANATSQIKQEKITINKNCKYTPSGATISCETSTKTCDIKTYSGLSKGEYYQANGTKFTPTKINRVYDLCNDTDDFDSLTSSSKTQMDTAKANYDSAVATRKSLEKYMTSCSNAATNYINNWSYNLNPSLKFIYSQQFYSGGVQKITEEVNMVISDEKVKYWPGVSKKQQNISKSSSTSGITSFGEAYLNNVDISSYDTVKTAKNEGAYYGGGDTKTQDKFTVTIPGNNLDYETSYAQKWGTEDNPSYILYYRPNEDYNYYSLLPNGKYVSSASSFSGSSAIHIGYVFNVEITNYQGEYETWFELANAGHLEKGINDVSVVSNVQERINNAENDEIFTSKCTYCDKEVIITRDCPTCDPEDSDFKPQYIFRIVSLDNLNPNNRDLGTNWSNEKGTAALEKINALGASDDTYNDATKEHLEYEFDLSTQDMQKIRDYNDETTYYDFDLTCNESGKECQSEFVTEYATDTSGRNKYKYYVDGKWCTGTIKGTGGTQKCISSGTYPDSDVADTNKIYP